MDRIWITRSDRAETFTRGIIAGSIAGVALAALETVAAGSAGVGVLWPWRMAASILLGAGAFGVSAGTALTAGLLVHAAMSLALGVLAAMLAEWSVWSRVHRLGEGGASAAGALFGALVWFVDFPVLAWPLFPWIWHQDQAVQFALHLVYGATLGVLLNIMGRHAEHPPDSVRLD